MRRATVLACAGLALIAVWAVLTFQSRDESRTELDSSRAGTQAGPRMADVGGHLGDAACSQCHPDQMQAHSASGHSHTFRAAADVDFISELNGLRFRDPKRDVEFHYLADQQSLSVTLPALFGDEPFPLDYAFGSGLHAVTFVTLVPDLSVPGESLGVEHRMSWITGSGPGVTPQTLPEELHSDVEYFGRLLAGERLERCFGCHTTTCRIQDQRLVDLRPNVGCERCHGPGKRHVQAVNAGAEDLAIRVTRPTDDAAAEVAACAECHRGAERVPPEELFAENSMLVRFQPIGLVQSACYLRSEGKLGCSSCHDPHAPAASRTTAEYEAVCLKCHDTEAPDRQCSVEPTSGCVACHMPPVNVLYTWQFHDHWIRVRDEPQDPRVSSSGGNSDRD